MRLAAAPRRRSRPSLIPLIDVMLVLLFFFMLVTSYAEVTRTPLTLAPAAGDQGAMTPPDGLASATLTAQGDLRVNNETLSIPRAAAELRSADTVRLTPERGVSLQALLSAWEALNRAGVKAELAEGLP